MSALAVYESNILRSRNKAGRLKMDDKGYREITLGAFDCLSEKGEYYDYGAEVKRLFDTDSDLQRRIHNRKLRGEVEHPYPQPGDTMATFFNRVRQIRNNMVGHHIRHVRLEPGKDHKGNPVVLVIGQVKGSGPYGPQLELRFDNPEENVDFSIRSLTRSYVGQDGIRHKIVTAVVTWDQVNEGGIAVANKYDTPSLEGIDTPVILGPDGRPAIEFSQLDVQMADQELIHQRDILGIESDVALDTTMVYDAMGWNRVQVVKMSSHSLNW